MAEADDQADQLRAAKREGILRFLLWRGIVSLLTLSLAGAFMFAADEISVGMIRAGLLLDAWGAVLAVMPLLKGRGTIAGISHAHYGQNPNIVREASRDRIAGWAGVTFLVGGFTIQLVGQFA